MMKLTVRMMGWVLAGGLLPAAADGAEKVNGLALADSPYLRSEADSPVQWQPWGREAFERADRENKPLFVNIGYMSCHWCALMDRESFRRPEVAKMLNEDFVSVRVDRYERPDLDRLYMRYMTETARINGWPLNLWLNPRLAPFRGVVYLPAVDTGRGTFERVAEQTRHFWEKESAYIREQATRDVEEFNRQLAAQTPGEVTINDEFFDRVFAQVAAQYDPANGGFGRVPKFPSPARLAFLWRQMGRKPESSQAAESRDMIVKTLRAMGRGGLRDHLGGGFFRYALDEAWRRPYFEKMALDQAEAIRSFLSGYLLTGDEEFASIVRQTIGYLERELQHGAGAFYNAEHCDSLPAGEAQSPQEGAYYLWTRDDALKVAGDEAAPLVEAVYSLKERGNAPPGSDRRGQFEGLNLFFQATEPSAAARQLGIDEARAAQRLDAALESLRRERSRRPRPPLDPLIIAQMNGGLISGLARASVILDEPRWLEMAVRAAEFVERELWDAREGRLYRCWAGRPASVAACAEDYAYLVSGLLDLHEASGGARWLALAVSVQAAMDQRLLDRERGGYYDAEPDTPDLVVRLKNEDDASGFSSNAMAAMNLARLAAQVGDPQARERGSRIFPNFGAMLQRSPGVLSGLACGASDLSAPLLQVVVQAPPGSPGWREAVRAAFLLPRADRVIIHDTPEVRALLSEGAALPPAPAAGPPLQLCREFRPLGGAVSAADLPSTVEKLSP